MDPSAAFERLITVDVSALHRSELEAVLVDVRLVQSAAEAIRLSALARLETLASASGTADPAATASAAARTSRREGERARRRSKVAAQVPNLQDALATGQVSPEHLDALANALGRLDPDEQAALTARPEQLAALARSMSADEFAHMLQQRINAQGDRGRQERFERQRRDTSLRWWTDPVTGMVRLAGEFDPETGLRLTSRLAAVLERLFHDAPPATCPTNPDRKQGHLRALALLHLVLGHDAAGPTTSASRTTSTPTVTSTPGHRDDDHTAAAGDDVGPTPRRAPGGGSPDPSFPMPAPTVDMVVIVDLVTLRTGLHGDSHIDTGLDVQLPAETLRRMACAANVLPAVLDGSGVVLDLGRRRRLASPEQRRALQVMYRTCGVDPGCRVPFHQCEPHHIEYWTRDDGPTDMDNLIPTCSFHHHAVHEGGWILELRASDRRLTVTRPDGVIHYVWPDTAERAATRDASPEAA